MGLPDRRAGGVCKWSGRARCSCSLSTVLARTGRALRARRVTPGARAAVRASIFHRALRISLIVLIGSPLAPPRVDAEVRAYITNQLDNSVSVIDVASRSVLATIPVGSEPRTLAIVPSRYEVYVSNSAAGTISIVDLILDSVVHTISGYPGVSGGAVAPDGDSENVGSLFTNTVVV